MIKNKNMNENKIITTSDLVLINYGLVAIIIGLAILAVTKGSFLCGLGAIIAFLSYPLNKEEDK